MPPDLQTCRQCRRRFAPSANGPAACVWHPDLFTGGELGKYTGFVPASPAFDDRMKARARVTACLRRALRCRMRGSGRCRAQLWACVTRQSVCLRGAARWRTGGAGTPRTQKRGMVRFWDCCGATDAEAPGCRRGPHVSYDEERTA
jgi:hypothetical protein